MTDTLAEIFARDPFTLTRDDPEVEIMVAHLRAFRAQFNITESAGERPKTPHKPRMTKEESAKALEGLNLNLDL